ncbi:glycerophosphoryl diester phosphodiesterase [Beggiatoa alba B18LD]|uniref:Glycerophosphoryl diester phosphodiesterase n=1 Tax=Beggiatoa alba B18LD TaxID=395493 RepID=I3CG58_9GAMM|nr:glycerophosphoryl diester phosphodiesterase [Beggiatoa alba]EIJ42601.1 glycerophosphoryl diester phosphodiesterase [Beggiatoa alba B18LD]
MQDITPSLQLPPVIAHRGASANAPENTLSAFRLAAARGAKWVELDVMLSACQTPIVFHDDTLERCSNGVGNVADYAYMQLRRLDAGSWFAPEFVGEHIPSLAETLALLKQLNMGLNLEIKPRQGLEQATTQAIINILKKTDLNHLPLLVSSFSPFCLELMRLQLPHVPRGLLVDMLPNSWQTQLKSLDCVSLHCDYHYLKAHQAKAIKTAGYMLLTYTVNQREKAQELFSWGVDAVFSDKPDLV